MRKILSVVLTVFLLISMSAVAFAADSGREYLFELTVDGADKKEVQTGDIITVVFNLLRTDAAEHYDMYAMQNEIRYDSEFFELVDGSALLSSGIETTDIGLRDTYREFYMNFVSLSGGEKWDAKRLVGSFQLRVIAVSGISRITCQDYLVSTQDGTGRYKAAAQNVTIIVSPECTVKFVSNGGTEVSDQKVNYGQTVVRPADPVREGYILDGWYSDIDLLNPWNFDTDTVQGNLTLYAKWEKGTASAGNTGDDGDENRVCWLLLILLVLLLILILLLVLLRKQVKFETQCRKKIKSQRVKKGNLVKRPEDPKNPGRSFAGWYSDKACTHSWDFQKDKVENNMILYAKWE